MPALTYLLLYINLSGFSQAEPLHPQNSIPPELDYSLYVKNHRKHYEPQEIIDRAKLFYGRTLKIVEHNELFATDKKSYFLAQNQFTDMKPEELEQFLDAGDYGLNPVEGSFDNPDLPASKYSELRKSLSAGDDGISRASSEDSQREDPGLKEVTILDYLKDEQVNDLGMLMKQIKREPTTAKLMSNLVNLKKYNPGLKPEEPKVDTNIRYSRSVESNNPSYDGGPSVSYGSYDSYVENLDMFGKSYLTVFTDEYYLDPFDDGGSDDPGPSFSFMDSLKKLYRNLVHDSEKDFSEINSQKPAEPVESKPVVEAEETIHYKIDWRKVGCISRPKSQGSCNACYAFSVLSLMEYFYCREHRELTDFSAQFVVDCGHYAGLKGCQSSKVLGVGMFIKEFGIELNSHYPYTQMEGQCPIENPQDRATSGYLRPTITAWQKLENIADWYSWLRKSPLLVGINMPADFMGYSGSIHDGLNCVPDMTHVMLLVGSGIQGGREFWLLKNSFSEAWGEEGYFRLSKDAPLKCFKSAVVVRASFRDSKAAV